MNHLLDAIQRDLLDPKTLTGAVVWGFVFMGLATALAAVIRRGAHRIERVARQLTCRDSCANNPGK